MGYYTPNPIFLWGYTSAKKQRRPRNTFVLKKIQKITWSNNKTFWKKKRKIGRTYRTCLIHSRLIGWRVVYSDKNKKSSTCSYIWYESDGDTYFNYLSLG